MGGVGVGMGIVGRIGGMGRIWALDSCVMLENSATLAIVAIRDLKCTIMMCLGANKSGFGGS
jgi:hypothetical protein